MSAHFILLALQYSEQHLQGSWLTLTFLYRRHMRTRLVLKLSNQHATFPARVARNKGIPEHVPTSSRDALLPYITRNVGAPADLSLTRTINETLPTFYFMKLSTSARKVPAASSSSLLSATSQPGTANESISSHGCESRCGKLQCRSRYASVSKHGRWRRKLFKRLQIDQCS